MAPILTPPKPVSSNQPFVSTLAKLKTSPSYTTSPPPSAPPKTRLSEEKIEKKNEEIDTIIEDPLSTVLIGAIKDMTSQELDICLEVIIVFFLFFVI